MSYLDTFHEMWAERHPSAMSQERIAVAALFRVLNPPHDLLAVLDVVREFDRVLELCDGDAMHWLGEPVDLLRDGVRHLLEMEDWLSALDLTTVTLPVTARGSAVDGVTEIIERSFRPHYQRHRLYCLIGTTPRDGSDGGYLMLKLFVSFAMVAMMERRAWFHERASAHVRRLEHDEFAELRWRLPHDDCSPQEYFDRLTALLQLERERRSKADPAPAWRLPLAFLRRFIGVWLGLLKRPHSRDAVSRRCVSAKGHPILGKHTTFLAYDIEDLEGVSPADHDVIAWRLDPAIDTEDHDCAPAIVASALSHVPQPPGPHGAWRSQHALETMARAIGRRNQILPSPQFEEMQSELVDRLIALPGRLTEDPRRGAVEALALCYGLTIEQIAAMRIDRHPDYADEMASAVIDLERQAVAIKTSHLYEWTLPPKGGEFAYRQVTPYLLLAAPRVLLDAAEQLLERDGAAPFNAIKQGDDTCKGARLNSRLSRTIPRHVARLTGDVTDMAFISGRNHPEISHRLAYTARRTATLAEAHRHVLEKQATLVQRPQHGRAEISGTVLALSPPPAQMEEWVGARRVPTRDAMRQIAQRLRRLGRSAFDRGYCSDKTTFEDATLLLAFELALTSGGRRSGAVGRSERQRWASTVPFLQLADKESRFVRSARIAPISRAVDEDFIAYGDLREQDRMRLAGFVSARTLDAGARHAVDDAREKDTKVQRKRLAVDQAGFLYAFDFHRGRFVPLTPSVLEQHLWVKLTVDGEPRWTCFSMRELRRYWRTELVDLGAPPESVDAAAGHGVFRTTAWHRNSALYPSAYHAALDGAIAVLLRALT